MLPKVYIANLNDTHSSDDDFDDDNLKGPDSLMAFCLWSVSQNTWVEEESLVYTFESWLAEFGGSLGLFLGFSFMTIWEGVKTSVVYMKSIQQTKVDISP